MKFNLHTHTKRCRHASGDDREYVERAIEAGMQVLGFSDHCPQFFPVKDYYSNFRMFPEQAQEYAESVRALQREYKNDIQILLGFETEYYPETFAEFMRFVKPLKLDYMILGQHFVGNEYDESSYYTPVGNRGNEFLAQYTAQVKEGLSTGAFSYIAHPDIVNFCGDDEFYREKMQELCRFAKKLDIPLEYNMLGYLNRRCYPSTRFWKIAAAEGNKTVIGFDAHSPEMLLQDGLYEACRRNLAALDITTTEFKEIKLRNEML